MSKLHPVLQDDFTPALHFKAPFGWINDPNGLFFSDGLWHLFYQFHPMSTVWGPMHWGHAVSPDLLSWRHLPMALAPDELGNIFSGSAVIDAANHSGLFPEPSDRNVLAFYTSSLPRPDGQPDLQTQSVASSLDGGASWKKWAGNPIIGNPGRGCFRDPKVFWFAPGGHWVMLLTHGQSVGIYRSSDLLHWSLASEFGLHFGYHSPQPWECPDLFELKAPDGTSRWVLVVGIADGCPAPGSGTQYFIGSFDGSHFQSEGPVERVRWLDLGRDHYATQTWFAAPQGRQVAIAWMSNWRYARNTSTQFFRGVMTLPRALELGIGTDGGPFVRQHFAAEIDQAFGRPIATLPVGGSVEAPKCFRARGRLAFEIGDSLCVRLFGDDYDQFRIERGAHGYRLMLERRVQAADEVLCREFPHDYAVEIEVSGADVDFDMMVDAGTVELLLDGGRHSVSQLFFPRSVAGPMALVGSASGALEITVCEKD